jgi:hypothetical protein
VAVFLSDCEANGACNAGNDRRQNGLMRLINSGISYLSFDGAVARAGVALEVTVSSLCSSLNDVAV